jgi:hypothetical protein
MEGLWSILEISSLEVGDVSKPEKSMASGSSDTAGKQRANCLIRTGVSEKSLPQRIL